MFKSDQPRNYPLNKTTAVCINTGLAYPFYIAPIVFPKITWLGLAPAFFGMSQAVGHGIIFPRMAGDKYSPGFLASFFLHIPIGVSYIRALKAHDGLTESDYLKGAIYGVAFAAVAVAGPNFFGRNKNSPNGFTAAQMGHHDVGQSDVTSAPVEEDHGPSPS